MASRALPRQRQDLFLAAVIIGAWLAVVATAAYLWLKPWPDVLFTADFVAFWSAGSMVRLGEAGNLFNLEAQRDFQTQLWLETAHSEGAWLPADHSPYYNAPIVALLFAPFSFLTLPWSYGLWALMSFCILFVSIFLPLRAHPWGASLSATLLASGGVFATLFEGQVNSMFALAISLGMLALRSGKPWLGGALLGLLWMKPQYAAVLLLILVAKRRWRESSGMLLAGIATALASLAMVGTKGASEFFHLMGRVGGFYAPEGFRISPEAMDNWRALLLNLWPGVSEWNGFILTSSLSVATVALVMTAWRGAWMPSGYLFGIQMLLAVSATLLASPHSHFHGTVLLLPPLALALSRVPDQPELRRAWRWLLALGFVLSLVAFPFRGISWLFVPYLFVAMAILVSGAGRPTVGSRKAAEVTA